jgi:hypothetical protein
VGAGTLGAGGAGALATGAATLGGGVAAADGAWPDLDAQAAASRIRTGGAMASDLMG